jgi:hypothetical protein
MHQDVTKVRQKFIRSIISVTENKHRQCNQILGKTERGTPFITKWAPENT